MKLITAVVRPGKLDEVMRAVTDAGAHGLTATPVSGFGQQHGHMVKTTGATVSARLQPKMRVDVVVRDEDADGVTEAIMKCACEGAIGDGKIWVSPLDAVIRVRTGERDDTAA